MDSVFGKIGLPQQLTSAGFKPDDGAGNINRLLDNIIGIFFAARALAYNIMFVWGALQMILSAGDNEAIVIGTSKMTLALLGATLLALSYFIFQLLEANTG